MSKKPEIASPVASSETDQEEEIEKNNREEQQVVVQIDINKRKTLSQEIKVTDNGEKVFSQFNTSKVGGFKSQQEMSLADYLPSNAIIRPGNIVFKNEFTPDGGRVIVNLTYQQ
ncbi:MAG: hypothetical protein JAZ03_15545 [Candidatus Thiodiazotropha taylori]|nr:hypothetical protein [Candidatus Thiodiazotropha taylori]MCW4335346.1 hypothetical protein [Candidatus Thiodiazotropha endolucinida]